MLDMYLGLHTLLNLIFIISFIPLNNFILEMRKMRTGWKNVHSITYFSDFQFFTVIRLANKPQAEGAFVPCPRFFQVQRDFTLYFHTLKTTLETSGLPLECESKLEQNLTFQAA